MIVMNQVFEQNFLERKTSLLMLTFGFASTAMNVFRISFQVYLSRTLAFNSSSAFGLLMNEYSFLLSPVLLFIAFYKICGRTSSERFAGALISLILGVVLGAVLGLVLAGGILALTNLFGIVYSLTLFSQGLQSFVTASVLEAFSALAFAAAVRKWDEKLLTRYQELKVRRPLEISIAAGIFALSGILALCVMPFLIVYPYESGSAHLDLIIATVALVAIGGFIELFVGYGIFKGSKWGWLVGFGASLVGLAFNAATLGILTFGGFNWNLTSVAEAVSAFLAICLELAVMGLLLSMKSRLYCRMVDPTASS